MSSFESKTSATRGLGGGTGAGDGGGTWDERRLLGRGAAGVGGKDGCWVGGGSRRQGGRPVCGAGHRNAELFLTP